MTRTGLLLVLKCGDPVYDDGNRLGWGALDGKVYQEPLAVARYVIKNAHGQRSVRTVLNRALGTPNVRFSPLVSVSTAIIVPSDARKKSSFPSRRHLGILPSVSLKSGTSRR
jgi:hypothetical protein